MAEVSTASPFAKITMSTFVGFMAGLSARRLCEVAPAPTTFGHLNGNLMIHLESRLCSYTYMAEQQRTRNSKDLATLAEDQKVLGQAHSCSLFLGQPRRLETPVVRFLPHRRLQVLEESSACSHEGWFDRPIHRLVRARKRMEMVFIIHGQMYAVWWFARLFGRVRAGWILWAFCSVWLRDVVIATGIELFVRPRHLPVVMTMTRSGVKESKFISSHDVFCWFGGVYHNIHSTWNKKWFFCLRSS